MKKPPSKMFFHTILSFILLLLPSILAAPSPAPAGDSASFYSSSGFISSPSIYSYTIENQIPYNQTTTIYQAPQTYTHQQQQPKQLGSTSRNLYYTSSNLNSNVNSNRASFLSSSSSSSAAASSSSTTSTTTSASSLAAAAAAIEATQSAPISDCTLDRLAVYKVVLHTYWTRDLFPKHYPDWRPTAQWTKTIGRTHDSSFALYHIGQQATSGVKQFTETGKSDILDTLVGEQQQLKQQITTNNQASARNLNNNSNNIGSSKNKNVGEQQQRSVFDEFTLPAITTGAGRTEAKFFVDSNHSLVSLMTRIVPSPDWFIGVDSFQLCVGGSWIDTVTVEMDPLDAGTDNGFTFTAPNWPTSPQGVIYRITSRYPAHPAGSFFYPKSKRLPPMATFQFIKLKEYELSEVFNFAEDDRKYETVQTQTHLEMEHNHVEMNNELSASIERERQNEITPQPTHETEKDRIRTQLLEKMNPMNNLTSPNMGIIPKNDKKAIMQNIANSYRRSELSSSSSSSSSSTSSLYSSTNRRRRTKRPRDCRVSHWSEWSDCSKTCGIGEMHRYRKVIKHGKRGGRPCPPLKESKWCGTEKGCHKPETYFNWYCSLSTCSLLLDTFGKISRSTTNDELVKYKGKLPLDASSTPVKCFFNSVFSFVSLVFVTVISCK